MLHTLQVLQISHLYYKTPLEYRPRMLHITVDKCYKFYKNVTGTSFEMLQNVTTRYKTLQHVRLCLLAFLCLGLRLVSGILSDLFQHLNICALSKQKQQNISVLAMASAARATPYWAPGPRKLIASVNVEQLVSTVRNHRDATAASLLGMDHVPFVVLRTGGFSKEAYAALVQMFAGQKELQHEAQVRWSCRTYLEFVIKRLAVTTVNQDWYNTRECMRAAASKLGVDDETMAEEEWLQRQQRAYNIEMQEPNRFDVFEEEYESAEVQQEGVEQQEREAGDANAQLFERMMFAQVTPGNGDLITTTSGGWYRFVAAHGEVLY